jgi:putative DNA-invertase from lambdoid prophage Rac
VLVVTKLDRLGRNAMDIRATIDKLATMKVHTHCLQLGGTDLTSTAGKMLMHVIGAMAEFERDLLIERTQQGLQRAKAEGTRLGRRPTLSAEQQRAVQQALDDGTSVSDLARRFKTSRQTIMRARDGQPAA